MNCKKILLIDDDSDDRSLFIEALQKIDSSIMCEAVESGEEGIALLEKKGARAPDMIFLDLSMPFTNGKKFLGWIKRKKRYSHIPIIIYSASRSQDDIQATKNMGALHFITKPAFFEDVVRAIRFAIKLPQLQKENAFALSLGAPIPAPLPMG